MSDLETLLEAHIVLRNIALDDKADPVVAYRCHKASLEINELRTILKKLADCSDE